MSCILEFYEDEHGRKPVLTWITDELDPHARRTLGTAMRQILQEQGVDVCGTPFGRQLGEGRLFEFRLRDDDVLLRVFCHAYGERVVLLLSGYDKAQDPSKRRQKAEIAKARSRLRAWTQRQRAP
ncbi:MAG: type II toxin-antitoxin system RelE/ParE family toxin [Candidatus Dormibacteria bacterium]